jgi:hypothetical protein
MNNRQLVVLSLMIGAAIANIYGAVTAKPKPRDPTIVIAASLIVTVPLVGFAQSEGQAGEIAELFAAAYFITSMALNATPFLDLVTKPGGLLTRNTSTGVPSGTGTGPGAGGPTSPTH